MTTETKLIPADVQANLQMVGCDVPDRMIGNWDQEMLVWADDWAKCRDLANNGDEIVTVPDVPAHCQEWLDTEGQVEQPGTDELAERTENLDRANRRLQAIETAERVTESAKSAWEESKKETADLKKMFDYQVNRTRSIIRAGNDPQKELPFSEESEPQADEDNPPTLDPSGEQDLDVLVEYRMTLKKIEAVKESCGGTTIADFEKWQRENIHWDRDIKGLGEEWITKLQDAQLAFRIEHPIPDPTDIPVEEDGGPTDEDQNGTADTEEGNVEVHGD